MPYDLRVGDSLDRWRTEELVPGHLLRLRAGMRLPGAGRLELSVDDDGAGGSVYRQRALFRPRGLAGHAYWCSISPFHAVVFGGMARNIARRAREFAVERAGADGGRRRPAGRPCVRPSPALNRPPP